jgi:3-aminobutyryl-CoA ammonia-lyase
MSGRGKSAPETRAAAGVGLKAQLRLRLSEHDAHYGGGLVDGARVLGLFGDVATELLVRLHGDEGLIRAYESVEFLAPLHADDFVEVEGEIVAVGGTSRKMRFEARKVIAPRRDLSDSAADALAQPVGRLPRRRHLRHASGEAAQTFVLGGCAANLQTGRCHCVCLHR